MSSLALWSNEKTVALTGDRAHHHKGPPVAPAFAAPALVPQIKFGPTALAASIARTATLRAAPPEAVARFAASVLGDVEMLIDDGPDFTASSLLATFVDTEKTHFAGRIGAGITDLYMNALDYGWRDNAVSLSSSLKPHADFLYEGGPATGHGVVLAEAHGSFAKDVTDNKMASAARRKYLRQVRPYIDVTSIHGPVIHGYALAFGAHMPSGSSFLRLSQTHRPKSKVPNSPSKPPPQGGAADSGEGTADIAASMALATYRSNFILMNALVVADWIDWLGGRRDFPEHGKPISFLRFDYAGRSFLTSIERLAQPYPFFWRLEGLPDVAFGRRPLWPRWHSRPRLDWFVMEERSAAAFLNGLSARIRSGPGVAGTRFELPRGDIAGFEKAAPEIRRPLFERGVRDGEDYDYALFRDGLALIAGPPPRKISGIRTWHPKQGLE